MVSIIYGSPHRELRSTGKARENYVVNRGRLKAPAHPAPPPNPRNDNYPSLLPMAVIKHPDQMQPGGGKGFSGLHFTSQSITEESRQGLQHRREQDSEVEAEDMEG